jgi:hypothetical protein
LRSFLHQHSKYVQFAPLALIVVFGVTPKRFRELCGRPRRAPCSESGQRSGNSAKNCYLRKPTQARAIPAILR